MHPRTHTPRARHTPRRAVRTQEPHRGREGGGVRSAHRFVAAGRGPAHRFRVRTEAWHVHPRTHTPRARRTPRRAVRRRKKNQFELHISGMPFLQEPGKIVQATSPMHMLPLYTRSISLIADPLAAASRGSTRGVHARTTSNGQVSMPLLHQGVRRSPSAHMSPRARSPNHSSWWLSQEYKSKRHAVSHMRGFKGDGLHTDLAEKFFLNVVQVQP